LPVRAAFTKSVRSAAELLSQVISTKSDVAVRDRALAIYSSLIGALVLSRAVDDAELSQEILQATLSSITDLDPS
jgi:TetR/AcrR family transcriptional repressor of nem operon